MELHAIFATWHLGDGNYPPISKGMLVNLSFEIVLDELKAGESGPLHFTHSEQAEYKFKGEVLRVYEFDQRPLLVVSTGDFRFYIYSAPTEGFTQGDIVQGQGILEFDHYAWVEFLASADDAPDLFNKLRIQNIHRLPTKETVELVADDDNSCYVVRFSDQDVPPIPIPRTFRQAG